MDNAVIHKSRLIREKIEEDHNNLLYSVPYHPESNAIEEYFSQLKHYIKKESPNTYDDIYTGEDLKPHPYGVLVPNM